MTGRQDRHRPATARRRSVLRALGAGVVGSALGAGTATAGPGGRTPLPVEASFVDVGVTGVAVGDGGRLFVNQPRFPWLVTDQGNRPRDASNVDVSVAEVRGGNSLVPYPDESWNADGWDQESDEWNESEHPAAETFVNVQSVYVDPDNPGTLWVLDTGNPELSHRSREGRRHPVELRRRRHHRDDRRELEEAPLAGQLRVRPGRGPVRDHLEDPPGGDRDPSATVPGPPGQVGGPVGGRTPGASAPRSRTERPYRAP